MAGAILLKEDGVWSAPTWLFDWLLQSIAAEVADPDLQAQLTLIVDKNIGVLNLSGLRRAWRDEVLRLICEKLPHLEDVDMPKSGVDAEQARRRMSELVGLAEAQE